MARHRTIRCNSISLKWQPARRREMRIHWILTATEYAVSNGGDHLSEQFLREILFKCYSGCTSKYHSSYQSFQQMLLNVSESSKINTGKHSQLMIHMCPNHLQYTCHLLVVPCKYDGRYIYVYIFFLRAIWLISVVSIESFRAGLFCNQAQLTRYHCWLDTKNFYSFNYN